MWISQCRPRLADPLTKRQPVTGPVTATGSHAPFLLKSRSPPAHLLIVGQLACLPLSPVTMVPAASTVSAEHLLIGQGPASLPYHLTEAFSPNTHSTVSLWRTHSPSHPDSHHDTSKQGGLQTPLTLRGCHPFHSQESEPEPTPRGLCVHTA